MAEIPEVFNQPGAGFVTLLPGIKFPPPYKEWQKPENARTYAQAQAHKGNVGVLAGNGYIGLDKDDPSAFDGLSLPTTTTWETRPGRFGMWFKAADVTDALQIIGKKADLAQIYLYKDGKKCGEIKLQRTYQVIPPSHKFIDPVTGDDAPPGKGDRVDYKLLDSSPPATISLSKLLAYLQAIGITFNEKPKVSRLEANTKRLEDMGKKDRQRRIESDESKRRRYAEAALRDETSILASTKAGSENRNNQLFKSAANMGEFIAAGALTEAEVILALSEAAENTGLESEEIRKTIISGLNTGKQHPREIPDKPNGGPKVEEPDISEDGSCDVQELITTFKKWLYIKEDYNVIGPFTGVIANFCDGSPDIIGIIGPSGSTKTEFIRSLGETQNEYVYPVSTITQHTLVSGHKDSRDLVPQLKGRILAIKDLTSILSQKEDVRAAIFADFRELTDEYIRKEFGNGIAKEYRDIHSSILFASTTAIERYYSMYSNLGQRMIFLRPKNDPKKARERASQNRGKQKEMRAELQAVTKRFIASMLQAKDEIGLPSTPEDIQDEMGLLYDFLAIARTTLHHDYKTGDIDELPEPEFPTRIANTIGRLCEVHALFYGRDEVNDEDMAFGCRIISDNIPSMRWLVLRALTREWQHTAKISQMSSLPSRSAKYHLDELVTLGLAEKLLKDELENSMDHRFDYFKLSEMAADALEKYDTRIRIEHNVEEELSKLLDKQNISLSNPCVISPCGEEGEGQAKEGEDDNPSPTFGKIERPTPARKEDPGFTKFKAGMAKRQCCLCGRAFPYDLTYYRNGEMVGYICATCHMEGKPPEPIKADPQIKLSAVAPAT